MLRKICEINETQLALAVEVIRTSFSTVAKEYGLTEQNCPNHTSFMNVEKLQRHFESGYLLFGLYDNVQPGYISEQSDELCRADRLMGYVSLSKENGGSFELHNLAVLPEYRHKGCGKQLLDFCKAKVKEWGGHAITIGIIEENTVLKNWYAANGFVHTGTRKFAHFPFTVGYMEWEE